MSKFEETQVLAEAFKNGAQIEQDLVSCSDRCLLKLRITRIEHQV